MKIWKKLMAAALVAALSVLMLTACDGEIMTKDPHTLIQWTQECAKENGVTLQEDNELSEGYRQVLEYNKTINTVGGDIVDLTNKREEVMQKILGGKHYIEYTTYIPDDLGMLGKISYMTQTRQWMKMYVNDLGFTPKRIGAVVWTWWNRSGDDTKPGATELIIVIAE